uniref:Ig-like domain-containing protein n=1 Tax=Gouania willdenowi TaxID=441366 RepID=A0A8C5DE61_GOUWI
SAINIRNSHDLESGHDVTLPCEAPDGETIIVVEWSRTDLKDGCVLLYRDKQLDPEYQLQSYRDRVDLQMKNRNISLILKNVSADDEGTYECRVFQRNSPRQQRSVLGVDPVTRILTGTNRQIEPGGDVTLTCEAPDGETIIVVECFRTDLKDDGYVLLYKDKLFDPEYQLQSYRDRVYLQMKNRTISLILKNVSSDDEGTYECRVVQRNSSRQQRSVIGGDPVCSISLRVGPPGESEFSFFFYFIRCWREPHSSFCSAETSEKNQYRVKNTSEELRSSLYLCVLVLLVFVSL